MINYEFRADPLKIVGKHRIDEKPFCTFDSVLFCRSREMAAIYTIKDNKEEFISQEIWLNGRGSKRGVAGTLSFREITGAFSWPFNLEVLFEGDTCGIRLFGVELLNEGVTVETPESGGTYTFVAKIADTQLYDAANAKWIARRNRPVQNNIGE